MNTSPKKLKIISPGKVKVTMFALVQRIKPFAWLLLCFAIFGCEATGPGRNLGRSMDIALLLPSGTGDVRLDELTSTLIDAAELAVAESGNDKIALKLYSTLGTPEGARAAASRAIADGANVIVGPLMGQNAQAISQIVVGSGVKVLALTNNPAVAGGDIYVFGQTFQNNAERLAAYARSVGIRSVMGVTESGADGFVSQNAIARASNAVGLENLGTFPYELTVSGIAEAAPQIVKEVEENGAEMLILSADTAGALPLLSQNLDGAGLERDLVLLAGLARWDVPSSTLSLRGLEGGIFVLPNQAASNSFVQRFKEATGTSPQLVTGVAYDAILAAIKTGGDFRVGETFSGVAGEFRIESDNTVARELAVAKVAAGSYQIVSPPRIISAGF